MFFKHILLIISLNEVYTLVTNKNACKTFNDYFIKDISPNCFYNPDVGVQMVCLENVFIKKNSKILFL